MHPAILAALIAVLATAAGATGLGEGPRLVRPEARPAAAVPIPVQAFDCRRKLCREMSGCAEACHKFRVCGHGRLDGDGDGIPCENVCSRPCPRE